MWKLSIGHARRHLTPTFEQLHCPGKYTKLLCYAEILGLNALTTYSCETLIVYFILNMIYLEFVKIR